MHSSRGSWMPLMPLLLLLLVPTDPARALSDGEKQAMVELHNHYRAQVLPPAANMLQMTWNEDLAAFAKAYAQKCVWGHNTHRGRRGENLFAITGQVLDVPLAMKEWYHEHSHYNFSAATCKPNQMCGHYTQVVWAKTERIGCGAHFCETLEGADLTDVQLLVCNYEPPGNVRGQRPYQKGTPCSQCPSEYHCKNSLCEPIRGKAAQGLPDPVAEKDRFLTNETLGTRQTGIPSSLATKTPSFLVTGVSGSLATKTQPAVGTKAPASLATEDPHSTATETPPSFTAEIPSLSTTHSLFFSNEGPASFLRSTHDPIPKLADVETSSVRVPSKSPQSPLHPEISLNRTQEPQQYFQGKLEAKVESSSPSEVLVSVLPVQGEAGGLQATENHVGDTSSNSQSNSQGESEAEEAFSPPSEVLVSVLPVQGEAGGLQATEDHVGDNSNTQSNFQGESEAEVEFPPPSEVLVSVLPVQGEAGGLQATEDHVGDISSNSQSNFQGESEDKVEFPPSSEVLVSDLLAQGEAGRLQATVDHVGDTSSNSLSNSPDTSVTANAKGGRVLALQSSFPGTDFEISVSSSGLNSCLGHMWGPLLLLPLLLTRIF